MNYWRFSYTNADAIDRLIEPETTRRHSFRIVRLPAPEKPKLPGRVCPDCNIRRTEKEFRGFDETFANCSNCWPKKGRRK